jgi:hypothetical protein
MRFRRQLVALGLLAGGLVLAMPASPAGAIPVFPGNLGNLQATFDNTGAPGFNTGPAATGVGAFRMDTGSGAGPSAGGKVFLHSNELDGSALTALDSWTFQYRVDPGSPVSLSPFANIRVNNAAFGNRTLVTESVAGVPGSFATFTVPTGATDGWVFTGAPVVCGANNVPVSNFSLDTLDTLCPGTTITGSAGGLLGGLSMVTGLSDGAGWAGWTGVIDDVHINANVYDLEPAQVTVTPASPIVLPSRDPQTVTFTLQASGWNSFPGTDDTGAFPLPAIAGHEIQVGFEAVGAITASGLAGVVPVATQLSQLTSPPPPITVTLDVTAEMIGSLTEIPVNWVAPGGTTAGTALNATVVPATTVLQLPPVAGTAAPATPATPVPADPSFTG